MCIVIFRQLTSGRLFAGHNLRAVLSVLLFLTHLMELSDALLSYSPSHVLTVPSAAFGFLIPVIILEHLLEKTSRPGFLLVTASLWSINCATRTLRLVLFVHLDIGFECLRPVTAVSASVICFVIAASEFLILDSEVYDIFDKNVIYT